MQKGIIKMVSTSLLLLLTAHLLGDFYFQPKIMVDKKNNHSIPFHLFHALIYGSFIYVGSIFFGEWWIALVVALSIALLHFGVDFIKGIVMNKTKHTTIRLTVFTLDQVLHIVTLIVASIFLKEFNNYGTWAFIEKYPGLKFPFSYNIMLVNIFSILFLFQPANILNKHILSEIFDKKQKKLNKTNNEAKAGMIIGILERLTMYAFCSFLSWYAIIPVVLTAKTFARFKRFSNEKNGDLFTEKYIVGTLLSTLYVGVCLVLGVLVA